MAEVKVPDIGDFTDVPVIEILVSVGDEVTPEQGLITLESDKATMDVPAPQAGTVEEVLVDVGDTVSEGSPIVRLSGGEGDEGDEGSEAEGADAESDAGAEGEDAEADRGSEGEGPGGGEEAEEPAGQAAEAASGQEDRTDGDEGSLKRDSDAQGSTRSDRGGSDGGPAAAPPYASPSVRRIARRHGVDLTKVEGSGRKGRITVEDVERFVERGDEEAPAGAALPGLDIAPWPEVDHGKYGEIERVELSRIKQISGPNLARNWVYIPHVTHHDEADITELEAFRKEINAEQDVKVTMVALLLKACVPVLKEYPEFNSSLDGDGLILKRYYHLGFAADTPQGLLVPVIRDVDGKGLLEIAAELIELSAKAREGKISSAEMSGATFTISSLGGIGGTGFTPIVNAPQVAILGVTRSAMKPVWDGEQFVPRLIVPLSLSYDHRVVDGAAAARFCVSLVKVLEDFRRILL
jgi:pyruvate dehydrogenase E2 component (dihydrolipoamide acetyltransferase)